MFRFNSASRFIYYSFPEALRPPFPASTILQEGGSIYLKIHLTVLQILLLQLDQWWCPVLHAQAGGRRAPPFLADGLASGLSVVQTPNSVTAEEAGSGQLVGSPILGHLGTWISPFALQLVLFALSFFLSFPLCLCPSLLLAPSPG